MREFKLIFRSGHSRLAIIVDYINSDYVIKNFLIGQIEKTPLALQDVVVRVE